MKLRFSLIYFILLFIAITGFSQKKDDVSKAIDEFIKTKYAADKPGASVLVTENGKVLLRKAYGLSDVDLKASLTPDHTFKIGSITKQFTASAVLRLEEQGKLSLQDNITKYLPDYPTHGKNITIEHLLTHTSGIVSYTSLPAIMDKDSKAKAFTQQEIIKNFKDLPLEFDPGEQFKYNNSGYFLLGSIIEKVTGITWSEYLKKNFFTPFNMTNTSATEEGVVNLAPGYVKGSDEKFVKADYIHPAIPFAAGAIFSTVDDLRKWNEALFNNKVINKQSQKKAWDPLTLNNGKKESYAYGWALLKLENDKVIAHGGGIDGYLSYALYAPAKKICIIILSNNMTINVDNVGYDIARILIGNPEKSLKSIELDTATLEQYIGIYETTPTDQRIITRKGKQLFSQRTGGGIFEIYPYAKDKFYFKDSPSKLQFNRDTKGKIESVELVGKEWINSLSKRTERPLPVEKSVITVSPAVLDQYVGEYELAPGAKFVIKRDNEKFTAQLTGQPAFEIYPESEKKFFYKVVDAQLEFNHNEKGEVSGLTLYQGGRVMPAKRIGSIEKKNERKAVNINPQLFDQYVGEYELSPAFKITIRKEEEKLLAQATGQAPFELKPENEQKFFIEVVDAQIEFNKDDSGKVTGLTLFQNGGTMPAKKIK